MWIRAIFVGLLLNFGLMVIASSPELEAQEGGDLIQLQKTKEEGFNAGEFIFEHIEDAHEWHILSFRGEDVSIPLPVILISKGFKFHLFLYSKLNHGHTSYHGFNVLTEGADKGKIAQVDEQGNFIKDAAGNFIIPLDISITKDVAALFISMLLLLWIFISVANAYKRNPNKSPKGLQSWLEPVILFIRDEVAKPSIGPRYEKFMPFLLSIFFFIWINNMMGIIPLPPGGANITGNIAVTAVLALFTFITTSFHGNKQYWRHIVDAPGVPWWLKLPVPLMPIVEIIGLFTKPFVLMIRLFANIAAGHIIALGFFCLIFIFGEIHPSFGYGASVLSVSFVVFMSLLELLVAFIQAYVFTLLSAIYVGMAIEEHH